MQILLEASQGLERKLKITIPAERVNQEKEKRLNELKKTASLPGFRKGNAPLQVIKQHYNQSVHQEVVTGLLLPSFDEAVKQENLKPASTPNFLIMKSQQNEPLEFEVTFEVYPEINVKKLNGVQIEKWVSTIEDKDIDLVLEGVRKQHIQWNIVSRSAQQEDQVIIDFVGTVEDKPFKGNQAKKVPVMLGSGRMIKGFEDGLIGAVVGEERILDLKFPEEYHAKDLAGKSTKFVVTVLEVQEPHLPALDDEFAKNMGIEAGLEGLRAEVKKNMERELAQTIASKLKTKVLDKVLELNTLEVPKALIENEAHHVREQALQQFGGNKNNIKAANFPLEIFHEQARRRVSLALLLSEILKNNQVELDQSRVKTMIENIAAAYQHPEETIAWYYNSKERLAEVQSVVLEDQIVERLLEDANVVEKTMSYTELMNVREEQ